MKKVVIILMGLIMVISLAACGNKEDKEKKSELKWPDSKLASLLPKPETMTGKVDFDSEDMLCVVLMDVSSENFDTYVDACKEKGFTVDYTKLEDYYAAKNKERYSLTINYTDSKHTIDINLYTPSDDSETTDNGEASASNKPTDEDKSKTDKSKSTDKKDGNISPELKEAMDSYEKFFDEYCAFMKKYQDSDDTTSMLDDYADYMKQYSKTMEKMDKIDEDELTTAEAAYYAEVTARITKKLAEIGQ